MTRFLHGFSLARSHALRQRSAGFVAPWAARRWPVGSHTGFFLVLAGTSLLACTIAPTPLTPTDLTLAVQEDQNLWLTQQEPVDHPLDLYEAVARALKYNLDYRVTLLEKTVALTEVDLSQYDLLPRLAARAGFDSRNSIDAARGLSLSTGILSTSYSTAQDREKSSADLAVVWNVLDFGVSYYQAKQSADRVLVATENRRKLAHNQFQEVQAAFWRAASAQQLQSRIEPVLTEARAALQVAHQVEKERLRPQLEMMRFQRELLEVVQQLETLREELDLAKKNLALLINLPPGIDFTLKIPDEFARTITPIRATVAEMEELALLNRPELRLEMYKTRISAAETRKALLRLLPGLELKTASHYDSNSFALHANWQDAGLQVTSNLMKLVAAPTAIRLAENQTSLNQLRRVALHMAILSQVHISHRKYQDARRKLETFSQMSAVDRRILENIVLEAGSAGQNRLEQIRAATKAIMSQLQRNKAYAELQNAIGLIFVSLGVDLLPTATPDAELPTLSQAIREAVEAWQEGISLSPSGKAAPSESIEKGEGTTTDQAVEQANQALLRDSAQAIAPPSPGSPVTETFLYQLQNREKLLKEAADWLYQSAAETNPEGKAPHPGPATPASAPSPIAAGTTPSRPSPGVPEKGAPPPLAKALPTPAGPSEKANPVGKPEKEASEFDPALVEEAGGETPNPVPSHKKTTKPATPPTPVTPEEGVRTLVQEWVDAWSRQDAATFLSFYSEKFVPENGWSRQQWENAYAVLLNPATRIRTTLKEWAVEVESENQATAYLRLAFASTGSRWEKRKTLRVQKEKNRWQIVAEKSAGKEIPSGTANTTAEPVTRERP
ncbi:MAG: TolC family protein [Magnetococcales bacterium]|nr:TolC family protein [Magnetococcales bacterium]